jgi:hypothetical protein
MRSFNVSVLLSLRDRVGPGLRMLSRDFSTAERRVRDLRLSLRTLEMQHALTARRGALASQADKDSLALLNARHNKLLALGATEQNLAALRQSNAAIAAREERSAIRRASQQLTLTRQLNRESQLRSAIQAEEAAGAARAGMVRGGIMLAGGALGVGLGVHAAKEAAQLQTRERFLQAIYGYTPRQTSGIRSQAFTLQQQLGNLSAGDVEQMRLTLLGAGLSRRTAGAVLPEVARVSDVLLAARGTSLAQSAAQLGQIANLLGARTAAQFRPVGEMLMKAALVSPGSLGVLQTQASYLAPLLRRGFSANDLVRLAVVAQREGGQGAISPENLSSLLARVQVMGSPMAPMALGGRSYYAAMQLGLPQFVRGHPHYTFGQFEHLMVADRRRLGSTQFLTFAKMLFGTDGLRTVEQLAKPQTEAMLEHVRRQLAHMGSSAQINAARLNTLEGQLGLLHSNFHSLIQVIGQPLVGPLQQFNKLLASGVGEMTVVMNRHKAATSMLGRAAFTTSMFAAAGGALKGTAMALRWAASRGWLTNAAKFAGGIDAVSAALGRLFPLVMAAQVGTSLGGTVAKMQMGFAKKYTPHGQSPLVYGTFGGYPFLNLSPNATHAAAVHVHGDIHLHGVQNPRDLAKKLHGHIAKHLATGLKAGTLSHGTANPVSVAPQIYGGYAGVG